MFVLAELEWGNLNTHGKVEDEDVCGVSHLLVEDYDEDDQEVADEADDDNKGKDDRDDDRDNSHQDLEVSWIHSTFVQSVGRVVY